MGVKIPRINNEPGPGHWRSLHIQGCALVGTWTSHTGQEDCSTYSGITSESCKGTPKYITIEVASGRTGFVGPSTTAPRTAPTNVDKPQKRRRLPLLGRMG